LDSSFPTLAEALSGAGYHTGAVAGHIFLGSKFGLEQGFDHYDESLVKATLGKSHLAITSEVITDKSISFLEEHAAERSGQPWMLWAHYFDPHNKYQPHKGITSTFGRNRKARYDGEIAYTDQHVGRLIQHLKDNGLYDNTIIVFVSDHGEEFNDHGSIHHGKTLFREVIRVPLAIRVPGIQPKKVEQLVGTIDIMPTLLDVLGIPGPSIPMSGQSLRPLLEGKDLEVRPVLLETYQNKKKDASLKGVMTPQWKLIIETPYNSTLQEEGAGVVTRLYNIANDPREKKNLANKRKDLVKKLNPILENMIAAASKQRERYTIGEQAAHSDEETRQLELLGYIAGPGE